MSIEMEEIEGRELEALVNATVGANVFPVTEMAQFWVATTHTTTPFYFERDIVRLYEGGVDMFAVKQAIVEAVNRPSVTPERYWSFVLQRIGLRQAVIDMEELRRTVKVDPEINRLKKRGRLYLWTRATIRVLVLFVMVAGFIAATSEWRF